MHRYRLLKLKGLKRFNSFELFIFLAMVIYHDGDVEKNPGPGTENDDYFSDTVSSASSAILHGNFSLVHYNVQSVVNKIDIIEPELSNFSLISLTDMVK